MISSKTSSKSPTVTSALTGTRLLRLFVVLALLSLLIIPGATWAAPAQQATDVVDTAAANADLSTLVAAIQAAGLADSLRSGGPFTIFAPTNDAFDALSGKLEGLLADPAGDLTQILLYHVISGTVTAADITDGMELTTLQGGTLKLTVTGSAVQVNTANVIASDIQASNGVIHLIDAVLTPPTGEETAPEAAVPEAAAPETAAPAAPTAEAPAAEAAAEPPSVTVSDQDSEGSQVNVPFTYSEGPGWMVIHADVDGRPGPVLGQTAVAPGANEDVLVSLSQPANGETTLWAMLHIDAGQVGVYEFPGPDVPVEVNDAIVMAPFTVNAPAASAGAAGGEAAGAAAETVTPEPRPEGTRSAPAHPAQMPTTGGALPTGVSVAVVVAVLALLAGATLVTRRPTA